LIGGRTDQLLDEPFDVPSILLEVNCQPVQKFRVAWEVTLIAKISNGSDQATSENECPHLINKHSRGQWIFIAEGPLGQSQSIGCVLRAIKRQNSFRGLGIDPYCRGIINPSIQNKGRSDAISFTHDRNR